MAGYFRLALLILTAFFHGSLARTWPDLTFWNLKHAEWELATILGVPGLDFVNNFMFPATFDRYQIIVGTAKGHDDNGEGCISIFSLRNRDHQAKNLAGNCNRIYGPGFKYRNGVGSHAHLMYPDHGQMTKDSKYILFVDKQSCARRVTMSTLLVETIIGTCGEGVLDFGPAQNMIGMVFLDEKQLWVICMTSGIYIYPWNGGTGRKVAARARMSVFHAESNGTGTLTRSVHNNMLVYQKVQYGVTTYNFANINITHGEWTWFKGAGLTKLFSCRPGFAGIAVHAMTDVVMSSGDGHVSQHPHYPEFLMVSDWNKRSIYLLNTVTGIATKFCKHAVSGSIVTGQDGHNCAFRTLRSTMWVGGEALAALIVDKYAWRIHEMVFINQNGDAFDNKCDPCWAAAGEPYCHDTRSKNIKCLCRLGWKGALCNINVCQNILCSNHGTCEPDDANRPTCVCNGQWRGDWCEVKRGMRLAFAGMGAIQIGQSVREKHGDIGEGFLMQKLNDPGVLIVGYRTFKLAEREGGIGYYRLGDMEDFIPIAGNMNRDRSPSRYNDGIGTAAHMMAPMFAYQQKNGAYLHFVDTNSCARRVVLQSMEVITWLGVGRCGNGTLDKTQYGGRTLVTGMTLMELTNRHFFAFSGRFGIYLYTWDGVSPSSRQGPTWAQASFYASELPLSGVLTHRKRPKQYAYQNTPYGITEYNFSWVDINSVVKPKVKRIASLKPVLRRYLPPDAYKDNEASLNYDPKQGSTLPEKASSMDVNPVYGALVILADTSKGRLTVFNKTDGNMMNVCKKGNTIEVTNSSFTCTFVHVSTAMWLTGTTALVHDFHAYGWLFVLRFKIGANGCQSSPCIHGYCSDTDDGFECLCHDDWAKGAGNTCNQYNPRTAPVFPTEEDMAGSLMSIGTSISEAFSNFVFVASLTFCYLHQTDNN